MDRRLSQHKSPAPPRRSSFNFNFSILGQHRLWFAVSGMAIVLTLIAIALAIFGFAQSLESLPKGLTVAGVPLGGLSYADAEKRLNEVYLSPIVLDYRDSTFQLDPSQVKFQADTKAMLAQTPQAQSFGVMADLWNYLWNTAPAVSDSIPLQATLDQQLLDSFIADVAVRYDHLSLSAKADPATLGFILGGPGYSLDKISAAKEINAALRSPTKRQVTLTVKEVTAAPPTFDTLGDLLRGTVRLYQFSGTADIFIHDLKTNELLRVIMHNQKPIDAGQGLAFSGMSTIKIPVMVTFFLYKKSAPSADEKKLLDGIFGDSANEYNDIILKIIGNGGGIAGADTVSDTMEKLGLPNTYLSGLLNTINAVTAPRKTPGNSRGDINLTPDRFNQTNADDMGRLLVMIVQCTKGQGKLIETFPAQFTPDECKMMIDLLLKNEVGPIFVKGGSPGATVAHKHGWDLLPLNNVADAAIVNSNGGDYVMTVYLHRDRSMPFDDANRLIVALATGVFNYYNKR